MDLAFREGERRRGIGEVEEFSGFSEVGGFREQDERAVEGEVAGFVEGEEVDWGGEGGWWGWQVGVGLEALGSHCEWVRGEVRFAMGQRV